jgi:hypothetical protein
MYADRLKAPLPYINGNADKNPETFPMKSERFYQALNGHGRDTRYVNLPHEGNGYRARESVYISCWNDWGAWPTMSDWTIMWYEDLLGALLDFCDLAITMISGNLADFNLRIQIMLKYFDFLYSNILYLEIEIKQ